MPPPGGCGVQASSVAGPTATATAQSGDNGQQVKLVDIPATAENHKYKKPDVIRRSHHKPAHKLTPMEEMDVIGDYKKSIPIIITLDRVKVSSGEYYRILHRHGIILDRMHKPAIELPLPTDPSAPLTACPFTKVREYPGCYEDCPDTTVCPRKGVTVPAPTTPEQTVVETVKRKSIDNADVKNVFGGLKERRGYNSPKAGAEAVAVRWMLKQGYSVPDILWTYDAMKQLAWWKDKFLNMQSVKQQIGEMLKKRIKS